MRARLVGEVLSNVELDDPAEGLLSGSRFRLRDVVRAGRAGIASELSSKYNSPPSLSHQAQLSCKIEARKTSDSIGPTEANNSQLLSLRIA